MSAGGRRDALVLDLDTRGGLCIARTLARGGLRVDVAARDAAAPGLRTRYAERAGGLPDPVRDFDAYADAIIAWVRERPADGILCSIDESVAALHARRMELEGLAAPGIASYEAIELASSKPRTLELAQELGWRTPRSIHVRTSDEAIAAAAEIGLPVVVKPVTSWRAVDDGGERVAPLFAATSDDVRRAADALVRPDAPALVQEHAPGLRETHKLFRAGGRTLARLVMVVERCWPPLGGASVLRRTVLPGDSHALAERLVEAIGLEGYSEVELRRDAQGRPLLMEVNPRISQSVELAVRAGVDFPRMQLDWARGRTVGRIGSYAVGVRLGWLGGDVRLAVGSVLGSAAPQPRLGSALRGMARAYLTPGVHVDNLDPRDLRPAAGSLVSGLRSLVRG
jgi:predicted ATP-grasp superfamily ATP-dependent carboligase